ncbi:MAG: hypothetical protein LUE93_04730 [Bacteroides sp.]|nr:hypothetical protein [Bacteroides sp.]
MTQIKQADLQIEVHKVYHSVDLEKSTVFALNYSVGDLTNPTAVKIPYSAQISLPKTKINNRLFANIGIRSTAQIFNPLDLVNFRLYINGSLYQTGYITLEEVNIEESGSYKIRLYGGLGNYFNYLRELPLSYLDIKANHSLNRVEVYRSITTDNGVYGYAITYQGEYDKFDADHTDNGKGTMDDATWTGNITYGSVQLDENKRSESTYCGEYRSYYQKPTLKVKAILNAIVEKSKEKDYTVKLDPVFFDNINPYYNDTWIICNNYQDLDDIAGGQGFTVKQFGDTEGQVRDPKTGEVSTAKITDNEAKTYNGGPINTSSYIGTNINLRPALTTAIALAPGQTIAVKLSLRIIATYHAKRDNLRQTMEKRKTLGVNFRVVNAHNGTELSGRGSAVASAFSLPTKWRTFSRENTNDKRAASGVKGKSDYFSCINYLYDSKGTTNLAPDLDTRWEFITSYTNKTSDTVDVILDLNITGNTYWAREYQGDKKMGVAFEVMEGSSIKISSNPEELSGRTDTQKTYQHIIGNEHNCFDFLVSYCKIFGLIFDVNNVTNEINIRLRDNYYSDGKKKL